MKNIKAILFDFGGTLDSDGCDWFTRIYRGIVKYAGPFDDHVFYRYAEQAVGQFSEREDTFHLTMNETVEKICAYIHKIMLDNNDLIADQWNPQTVADEFITEAGQKLHRNRQLLNKLSKNFRLGCISNNWGNVEGWCRQFDFHHYFETMIDSALVGSAKPDKKIFQAALDEMQLPAAACVYVGDKYECDIVGAHQVGMYSVWLNPDGEILQIPSARKIARLTDLADLLATE